jgi:hypothetical protein
MFALRQGGQGCFRVKLRRQANRNGIDVTVGNQFIECRTTFSNPVFAAQSFKPDRILVRQSNNLYVARPFQRGQMETFGDSPAPNYSQAD